MEIKLIVKEDFIVIDEEATISEMVGLLRSREKHSALIFRQGKYLGLVEKKKAAPFPLGCFRS